MGWPLRVSDKTVRKFAELPIYYQRQKCSTGNVVSGSIRYMLIFAGVNWGEASNESAVVENGDFRFFRSLSSEHFQARREGRGIGKSFPGPRRRSKILKMT